MSVRACASSIWQQSKDEDSLPTPVATGLIVVVAEAAAWRGLSFTPSTQAISGTPTTAGSWTVTYTANDGRGGIASTTFVYTINNPVGNQAPVLVNPLVDQFATGGVAFSYEQGYDAVGRLVLTYRQRTMNSQTVTVVDRTTYDLRGQRTYEFHQQTLGFPGDPGVSKRYSYDAAGQLIETRSYYANGWEMNTPMTIEGVVQTRDVSGWLSAAEQLSYDGDGRVRWQLSLVRAGTTVPAEGGGDQYNDLAKLSLQSRVDYTLADGTPGNHDDNPSGYDGAGRLSSYRYTAVSATNVNYTHTFTSSYEGWEGWVEKTVTGVSSDSTYKPTTNTLSYDSFGRLIKQQEKTEYQNNLIDDRVRAYSNTAEGQVQSRRDGTWKKIDNVYQFAEGDADALGSKPNYGFVYSGGQQVAELKDGGKSRAGAPMGGIQSVNGGGAYVAGGGTVAALQGESLRGLAQRVYGSSTLWYVLADANGMSDPEQVLTAGVQLKAPSMGVNTSDANTFRPYDPNAAIGSTSPGLPYIQPPSVGNCGMIVRIFAVVVAAVVAYYTWDPGTTFSVYAAIVGAGGEAVAQTIEIGEGARQGYSAAGIVGAGLGAGFGGASGIENVYVNAAVVAANSYTSNYALSKVFNEEAHFSWRKMLGQVAAAVVTAGIFGNKNPTAKDLAENGQSAGQSIANTKFEWKQVAAHATKEFGKNLGREVVGGYVSAAITGDKYRFNGRHAFASAAANAFGNTAIMAGNGAFRVQAEPESGYTLYDVTASDPFAVQQIQDYANESMGGLLSEYGYNATLGDDGSEATRLASIAADRAPDNRIAAVAPRSQRSRDLSALLFRSLTKGLQEDLEWLRQNPDGNLLERQTVVGSRNGGSTFSGDNADILRYLSQRNPSLYAGAREQVWRGQASEYAIRYKRGIKIPLNVDNAQARRLFAYNEGVSRREWSAYLGRAYAGRTNSTPYAPQIYEAGAQQRADLIALANIPVGLAQGLGNGVAGLAQISNPFFGIYASLSGNYDTWQPFKASNTGQQFGQMMSIPVSMVVAPETLLLKAATVAPRAYTGLRTVRVWEDLGGAAANSASVDFMADTGRLGGTFYAPAKLGQPDRYLARRGVALKVGDEFVPLGKAGGFDAAKGELILRSNPTQYEVWHELSHYRQYQQLGRDAYMALPRSTSFNAPEQFVFDMLENSPRRWSALTYEQQQHAIWYINKVGGFR